VSPASIVLKVIVIMVPVPLTDEVKLAKFKITVPFVLSTVGAGQNAPGLKPPSAEETYCNLEASKLRLILAPLRSVASSTITFTVPKSFTPTDWEGGVSFKLGTGITVISTISVLVIPTSE
jgi:hypothetical protein